MYFIMNGGPGGTRTPGAVRHRVYSAAELPLSDRPTINILATQRGKMNIEFWNSKRHRSFFCQVHPL